MNSVRIYNLNFNLNLNLNLNVADYVTDCVSNEILPVKSKLFLT